MSILDFIRPEFLNMKAYDASLQGLIRMHANELPWTPLNDYDLKLNHYPDFQQQLVFETLLAEHYQLAPEQLLLTRGSDNGLDLLMRLVLSEGQHSILQCPPTFSMYAFYAQLQNAKILECPLLEEEGFQLSVDKLVHTWQTGCKIVILCQPNNPTGTLLDLASIAEICSRFSQHSIVLVDEAYIEFSDSPSSLSLLSDYPNLVVLRTLSKAYGLAGLRLGVILAAAPLISALKSIMPPYTLPSPVLCLAEKAMQDKSWFESSLQSIIQERRQLQTALEQLPCIERVFPSQGNFLLVKSKEAAPIAQWLAAHQLQVRHFTESNMQDLLRISIGSPIENQTLLRLLAAYALKGVSP